MKHGSLVESVIGEERSREDVEGPILEGEGDDEGKEGEADEAESVGGCPPALVHVVVGAGELRAGRENSSQDGKRQIHPIEKVSLPKGR
jgi:hypothetical protein